MKKLFIFLFIIKSIFASENYELNLYEKILPVIFKKDILKVYVDEDAQEIIKNSKIFIVVKNCHKASLLIGSGFNFIHKECLKKPLFATDYKSFITNENSFGAFYWRKSRPQIKFKSNVLFKYHLTLPNSLIKFTK